MAIPPRTPFQTVAPQGVQISQPYRPSAADFMVPGLPQATQSVEKLGNVAAELAQRDLLVQNATVVKGAETDSIRQMQDILTNNNDAYYKKQGLDAKNAFQPTMEALEKVKEESLKNPNLNDWSRQQLKQRLDTHITALRGGMGEHQLKSTREWEVNTNLGRATLAAQTAVQMPDDDTMVQKAADEAYSSTLTAARLKGLDPDTAQALAVSARSGVHTSIMQIRSQKDPRQGLAYYERNKQFLDDKDRVRMEAAMTSTRVGLEAESVVAGLAPNATRRAIVQDFTDAGYPLNVGAAVAGGVQAESQFSHTARGDKGMFAGHPAGPDSEGMLQWNRERLQGLKEFANGRDYRDPDIQRKYILHELKNNPRFASLNERLKNKDITLEEANRLITEEFIVPRASMRDQRDTPAGKAEYAKRLSYSRFAFNEGGTNGDRALRDEQYARLQGVLADPNMDQRVKDEVRVRMTQAASVENMRRDSALKNARDLEDATIVDALQGKIDAPIVATKLTEAATMALSAGDRTEHRRMTILATNAQAIARFKDLPLNKAKEAIAAYTQGVTKQVMGTQIAEDKEARAQQRLEAADKAQAFDKGIASGTPIERILGLGKEAFDTYVKTEDWAKAADLQRKIQAYGNATILAKEPRAQVEEALRFMNETLDKNGASLSNVYMAEYLQKMADQQTALRKADPFTYVESKLKPMGLAAPAAINWNGDPETLSAQLRMNDQIAKEGERLEEGAVAVPPMRTHDSQALWQKLQDADPSTKQRLLSTVGRNITGKQLERLAPILSSKGPAGDVYYAAMIGYSKSDPYYTDISNRMLKGADLIWKGGDAANLVESNDLVWRTQLNYKIGGAISGMRAEGQRMLYNSIKALYVEDRGRIGAQGEPTDTEKIDKAVKDAIGEVDTMPSGAPLVLPRGINRSEFFDVIRNGFPENFTLKSADGTVITPDKLIDRGIFQSVGDGRYLVMMPEGQGRSGVPHMLMDPDGSGRPFVFDATLGTQRLQERKDADAVSRTVKPPPVPGITPWHRDADNPTSPIPAPPGGADVIRQRQRDYLNKNTGQP